MVAIVLALSFVVLLLAFRSLVVPLLAIGMNLLSVGAAYGILTLVTQKGYGAGIFGFQQVSTVEAWIPLFLFSVLFGLSMDYHVFLLSRIRERFDATGDTEGAIAHGITSSARLITGAALIMVAVFAGFASGQLVMFQQMGFGLAVAILIDATLVRTRARACRDEARGPGELVPAALARLAPSHERRGRAPGLDRDRVAVRAGRPGRVRPASGAASELSLVDVHDRPVGAGLAVAEAETLVQRARGDVVLARAEIDVVGALGLRQRQRLDHQRTPEALPATRRTDVQLGDVALERRRPDRRAEAQDGEAVGAGSGEQDDEVAP